MQVIPLLQGLILKFLLHGYENGEWILLKEIVVCLPFVIWDDNTKTLYGARDFFEFKAKYYSDQNGKLIVVEFKALVYPGFKKEIKY